MSDPVPNVSSDPEPAREPSPGVRNLDRAIAITYSTIKGWRVEEAGRYHDKLAWEEMLGIIASMTLGKGPDDSWFPLRTKEQWREMFQAVQQRLSQ